MSSYKRNYKVGLKKYYNHSNHSKKVIGTDEFKMDRNSVIAKILKEKREETLIDLSKYGLMPKNASEKERVR